MRRFAVVAAACAVLAVGCGGGTDETVIGVRRVSLGMVYSDQALKVPVPPRVIVEYVPAEPAAILRSVPEAAPYLPPTGPGSPPPPPTRPPACPKAPKDAPLPEPAPAAITVPPAPVVGTYLQQNRGTIRLAGPVPLTFPYPALTKVVVRDVRTYDVFDAEYGQKRHTSFVLEDQVLPTFRIISSYDHDDRSLVLTRREVVNGTRTTVITPTPAVQVLGFGGPRSSWTSAGVDLTSADTLTISGSIGPNEPVDVCGTLVDTIHASTDEQQVSIDGLERSGTRPGMPNITGWATQLGGLPVRREQHTTQVVSTDDGPVTFETDVVSTLLSTSPVADGSTR